MARTSRNGAPNANNVQALDNLDLDDMFAEGNDDLFGELDGLGMDLGPMDEFTGANNVEVQGAGSNPAVPEQAAPAAEETPKRRKTKRKTSAPAFFDDDDEDFVEEPNKKKKRVTKATTTKRRASTKNSAPQPEVKVSVSQKKGKSKSVMPPPSARPVSLTSSAAAARRKSGGPGAILGSISTSPAAPQKLQPSLPVHAGLKQSSFCGIRSSRISFYPFLPALPQEVAMKNRKVFSLLDKIHSKFLSELTSKNAANNNGLQSTPSSHVIAKLMQEAYKEDKNAGKDGAPVPSKDDVISSAVGTSRIVVDKMNKGMLAQDLLAVCALLKRQYNFLKQNSVNMEHWCRDNFSSDGFAEVYTLGKRGTKSGDGGQAARQKILSTFKVSTIRVKIVCTGYKEGKTKLMAVLPLEEMAARGKGAKAGTKRKTPEEDKSLTAAVAPVLSHQAQYAQMRPAKRRKAVADLVSKVAYSLETKHQRRIQERKQAIAARHKLARETATDQSFQVIHTVGMWKWLEQMGYCDDTADEDAIRVRLEDARSLEWGPMLHEGISVQTATIPGKPQSSGEKHIAHANARPVAYVNNLLDLLVDEGDKEDGESDTEEEEEDDINFLGSADFGARRIADLSALNDEERTYLHLRSIGFLTESEVRPGSALSSNKFPLSNAARPRPSPKRPSSGAATGGQGSNDLDDEEEETIDSLLENMKKDLLETTKRNHRRSTYLEAVAQATLETPNEFRHRKQFESALNARHVSIIKRTKEARAKGSKNKATKNDDLALPW